MVALPALAAKVMRKSLGNVIPARWRLPWEYYLYRCSADCEPELKWLEKICPRGTVALDVGANIGVYSYRMAQLYSQVYAFEINPDLTDSLAAFGSDRITVIAKGLSSSEGSVTLRTPIVNRIALTGWASLEVGNCPDADEYLERAVDIATLDSFHLRPVSLIKIDVEGHELEVLRGAANTLIENRPVVVVEIKEKNRAAVESFFARLKYRSRTLDDLVGKPGGSENHIFLPQ